MPYVLICVCCGAHFEAPPSAYNHPPPGPYCPACPAHTAMVVALELMLSDVLVGHAGDCPAQHEEAYGCRCLWPHYAAEVRAALAAARSEPQEMPG